jgi:hypothetical protein
MSYWNYENFVLSKVWFWICMFLVKYHNNNSNDVITIVYNFKWTFVSVKYLFILVQEINISHHLHRIPSCNNWIHSTFSNLLQKNSLHVVSSPMFLPFVIPNCLILLCANDLKWFLTLPHVLLVYTTSDSV